MIENNRRLAAHGAGEGLREACAPIIAHFEKVEADPSTDELEPLLNDDDGVIIRVRLLRALRQALLTPPTDAGSTTREGGEGVTRLLTALGKIMPISTHNTPDYAEVAFGGEGHSSQAMTMNPADWNEINAAYEALATTPSPDASPDSGEAERLADELDKLSSSHRPLLTAAANELRRLAAAPAPSPEAPANRQEAGEVEVGAEDNARADAWADFRDQHLEDGNDGYIAAAMYERARVAFDEGWAGGRAPAFSHAFAALMSLKDLIWGGR